MASPQTFQPSDKDTGIRIAAKDTNYSTLTAMYLRKSANSIQRNVIAFDISDLPAGVTISSAKLSLYFYVANATSGLQVDVFKQTRDDWVETEVTWNSYKTGSAWTTEGGDYVTSSPAGADTVFPVSYDWMDWEIKDIAIDAVANVGSIVNLLVKYNDETGADGYGGFYTRKYANTALRPKLVINYSVATTTSPLPTFHK